MPIKYLNDEEGESIRVLDIDGYYLPTSDRIIPNQEEVARSMRTWKAKDDDVLLCAYPKSGTHWLWEVVSMLFNGSADRINLIKETAMLEGVTQGLYDNIKSPRVLNSHIYFRMLPEDFVKRKCKIVYILRNPKDVAVSFYNHHFKLLEYEYSGKWENYFHRFLKGQVDYGSWFDYTLDWEKVIQYNPDYPIHIISYEDMKKDDTKEIKHLARFLGVKEDEELIKSIAEACDFERMKKEKTPLEIATADEWRDKEPGMYRKGQVGDWKNWFTVAQNELFDAVYAERMKNSKFQFRCMV
ncbi:hypothetical protein ACJMK2_011980 [Sinanodonta woodiana]|uniref:Sulfotransferase domain-containing protein n=1 Tax=Sinanodonta woodiana TaxID=1069815 RepID=A0ABD3V731_SINWO